MTFNSFINKLSSVQPDFSTKHTARVKPSQYIAQHLYEQKHKSNCSSCSSQTSYLTQPRSSKVFNVTPLNTHNPTNTPCDLNSTTVQESALVYWG